MKISFQEIINKSKKVNIKNFELSGGIYEKNKIKKIIDLKNQFNFVLHNYFPAPLKPFTMNLASLDDNIFYKTLNFIEKNINHSHKIGSKYYSLHAGFLIDPKPKELGRKIKLQKINDEETSEKRYLKGLYKISKIAKEKNIEILVENNVLTKKNLNTFSANPLMMVSTNQSLKLLQKFPNNVNMLVDLGHLKVSSKTLNFSPEVYLKKCQKWIKGYQLSDNNGVEDQNKFLTKKTWFLPFNKKNLDYYSLELNCINFKKLKSQINLLKGCIQ